MPILIRLIPYVALIAALGYGVYISYDIGRKVERGAWLQSALDEKKLHQGQIERQQDKFIKATDDYKKRTDQLSDDIDHLNRLRITAKKPLQSVPAGIDQGTEGADRPELYAGNAQRIDDILIDVERMRINCRYLVDLAEGR